MNTHRRVSLTESSLERFYYPEDELVAFWYRFKHFGNLEVPTTDNRVAIDLFYVITNL